MNFYTKRFISINRSISLSALLTLSMSVFGQHAALLPIKIDHKWGFINPKGEVVIAPQYDFTEPFVCNLARVKQKGYVGVVDQNGNTVVPVDKKDIEIYCPNLISVKIDSLWGLDDHSGNVLLPPNYASIDPLNSNTLVLKRFGLCGLYQIQTGMVIEPTYTRIEPKGSFYLAFKSGGVGLVDSSLQEVLEPKYAEVMIFPFALAAKEKEFWGMYSLKGTKMLQHEYMSIKPLGNYVMLKSKKGGWLLFNPAINKMIHTEEQEGYSLLEKDLIMTNKNHKHGVIDALGSTILGQNFTNIHLNNGLLLVERGGKWGLTDKKGGIIIETVHKNLFPFRKNVAVFQTETGKGIIDNKGKIVLNPTYADIDIQADGTAICTKKDGSKETKSLTAAAATGKAGKSSGKNKKEEQVNVTTEMVEQASHGHAWLKGSNKKWGLLGHDTLIVPFRYDEIEELDANHTLVIQKADYRTNVKMYGYINSQKLNELAVRKEGLVDKSTGNAISQPNFWYIRTDDFKKGSTAKVVAEGGVQALLSISGKTISEYTFLKDKKTLVKDKISYIGTFIDGVARFCSGCAVNYNGNWESTDASGGKWGFIQQNATVLLEPQFDEVSDLINERAIVKVKGLYGLIRKDGSYVLKPEYQNLTFLEEASNEFVRMDIKRERFGIVDKEGKLKAVPMFDKIFPFKNGLARVMVNGKYGFIDSTNSFVVEPKYENANDYSEGLAAVQVNKKWGYLNTKGVEVILPTYQAVGNFKSGLSPVLKDGKIGYIQPNEKLVVAAIYAKGTEFVKNTAVVTSDKGKQGIIDTTGKVILDLKYDEVKIMNSNRFAKVKTGNAYKIYDTKYQKFINKKSFDDVGDFSSGMAVVKIGNYYNYIDSTGKMVITKKYAAAAPFSNGLARVKYENKFGFINTKGDVVFDFLFNNATEFSENRAFIEGPTKLYGLIDKNGKHLTFDKFGSPKPFSSGYALILGQDKKYYFIDTLGNRAFGQLVFEQAYSFEGKVARVKSNGKWGLLHSDGYLSLDFKYDHLGEFAEDQAMVGIFSSAGILDMEGRMIAEPVFDKYEYLGNKTFRLEKWDLLGYFNLDNNWIWPLRK